MTDCLRFPTEQSRLRKHREPGDTDPYRNPFQRDRDRIIHSRAFRRLAGKTQVTTLPDSHHCRTRLTHTIEVSQVARTLSTALGLNTALVEALALGHDLGHPAFGHAGEAVLNEEMQRLGSSFDHNFHALRIVEHFERQYAAFRGLNLTFEVREGLVKHSRELDPENERHAEYLPELRPLLEAQIIDYADEIAYLSADIEDAADSGVLDKEILCSHVPMIDGLVADVQRANPDTSEQHLLREVHRRLVGKLVRGLIRSIQEAARNSGARNWEEVRHLPQRIVRPTSGTARAMNEIRSVLTRHYYAAGETRRLATECANKLRELFRHYMSYPESLPVTYLEQIGSEPLHEVVCDYVAGMTDSYLLHCHDRLLGGKAGEETRRALA